MLINIITNDIENQGSMIAAGYGSQDTRKFFARFGDTLDDGLGGKYNDMDNGLLAQERQIMLTLGIEF